MKSKNLYRNLVRIELLNNHEGGWNLRVLGKTGGFKTVEKDLVSIEHAMNLAKHYMYIYNIPLRNIVSGVNYIMSETGVDIGVTKDDSDIPNPRNFRLRGKPTVSPAYKHIASQDKPDDAMELNIVEGVSVVENVEGNFHLSYKEDSMTASEDGNEVFYLRNRNLITKSTATFNGSSYSHDGLRWKRDGSGAVSKAFYDWIEKFDQRVYETHYRVERKG